MTSIDTYRGNDDTNGGGYDLANYQNQIDLAPKRTLTKLLDWARAAQAAHQVAESLVRTSFVPQQFRGKAHEATAAILAGDEVGLSPMASLNAFDVIQGAAAAKAITLRAIVQSHGHEVWQVEATESRAIFKGRRRGSEEVHESVWTIDRARGLGLLGKDNWKKQAKAMLIARATAEVCRLTAADAILGIPYSAEELADGAAPTQEASTSRGAVGAPAAESGRRTARRRTQPRSAPPKPATADQEAGQDTAEQQGPPLPGEDDYDEAAPAAEQDDNLATKDQLTRLHTVFSNGGVKDKTTRLQACCLIIGRDIASSTELTRDEASGLIRQLEELSTGGEVTLAEVLAEMIGDDEPPAGGEQE